MKKILILLLILTSTQLWAQKAELLKVKKILNKRGEVVIKIPKENKNLNHLTQWVSIDKVDASYIWAYVNEAQFNKIQSQGISYEVVENQRRTMAMASTMSQIISSNYTKYPTYDQYDSLMHYYVNQFPNICELIEMGTLNSGRKLMALHISDSLQQMDAEPQFLYTSSMHGDETAGYILMLHLIDTLLNSYGQSADLTHMVDHIDIFINPLANPDGTYFGGNNTVNAAKRYNLNNVDLNRNYPDFYVGLHPDGNATQAETQYFMNFADSFNFVMSANFHGGVEVINYPWDTWSTYPADRSWWEYVCNQYVDSVHGFSTDQNYMTYLNNGVTNGFQWYVAHGTRQDYMNYYRHCRELTIELSDRKLVYESQLHDLWEWNKRSLLHYMQEVEYGLKGSVVDSITQLPIKALVSIPGFDKDSSEVYSNALHGDYYRLLDSGNYNVKFSAPGYYSKTISSVHINRKQSTALHVALLPKPSIVNWTQLDSKSLMIFPNPASQNFNVVLPEIKDKAVLKVYNLEGKCIMSKEIPKHSMNLIVDCSQWPKSIYQLKLMSSCTTENYQTKLIVQ